MPSSRPRRSRASTSKASTSSQPSSTTPSARNGTRRPCSHTSPHGCSRSAHQDFFNEGLCRRLETLHQQIHRLVALHFPALWAHWKRLELRSDLLFANFLICLFTSFGFEPAGFVHEFWDAIVLEDWSGVCAAVMFVLQAQMGALLGMGANETLRHFSEMKMRPELCRPLFGGFKAFAAGFALDRAAFDDFGRRFGAALGPCR